LKSEIGMVTSLTPDEVRHHHGKLFSRRLITLVDERVGRARIHEECCAQGPVEWDAVNRLRARGVVERVEVQGTTLIMDARIGEGEVRFGPASREAGGQALRSVRVKDGKVETVWIGLAGASVGVGACLPQAEGVEKVEYLSDEQVGGSKMVEVRLITPVHNRLIIGIDDTDTKEKGATWVLGLNLARKMPHGLFLSHKIVQLNPHAPQKTTNCAATGVSFAVRPDEVRKAVDWAKDFVEKNTYSDQTCMAVFEGLEAPKKLVKYGVEAKQTILSIHDAEHSAKESGVEIMEVTGRRGCIGAVAAIGCFDLGLYSAGLPEDFRQS
jgi:methanogenesis imperfect marker protein 11